MARYRRRDALEFRIATGLEIDGVPYTVDLSCKRATGVPGYRMTLAYVADDGSRTAFVELEPAQGREEARERAEALGGDPVALAEMLRSRAGERP